MSKVAIITGASKGIGFETMSIFEESGYTCYDFSRTSGIDITNQKLVNKKVKKIFKKHGRIDILVNNAGIVSTTDILDMSLEEWDNILNVNLTGAFICTKSILPYMLKGKGGKIVNVSSIAGVDKSKVASVAYTASKHGLVGLTKQLAYKYAKHNINVNCVAPSQTKTEMLMDNLSEKEINKLEKQIPNGRLLDPSEVANTIYFLTLDETSYINGEVININGGQ